MKRTILITLALGLTIFAIGCSQAEEPYKQEGPGADNPSVGGAVTQGGSQSPDGGAGAAAKGSSNEGLPTRDGK